MREEKADGSNVNGVQTLRRGICGSKTLTRNVKVNNRIQGSYWEVERARCEDQRQTVVM